ncbi:MAG TPA: hypothetical protein GX718_00090 [Brevibacterium sp.]|nr:hypothetical protein [Brevibacterium sp.]
MTLPGEVLLPSPEGTRWLLDICRARNVGLVIVDSAKDAVDGDLSTPAVGASYARFRQALIRDGVDVIDLLHPVKTKERLPELSSIAGSGSLYRGVGSALFLIPQADKTRVQLHQIKPLKETVEPFMVVHDLRSGRSFLEGDARAVGTFDVVRRVIEENGGAAAPAVLADALGIHRNRLIRDLKPLIDKGLVTPEGSTRDRRYRLGTDVG